MNETDILSSNDESEEKLSTKNIFMFSLGTIGRDMLYHLFNSALLSFILFTKNLTSVQFASISLIIIGSRIFDAFNDPIMGGIIENTRTKWGKFKPWQLIGAILSAIVVVSVFVAPIKGGAFIGFLAAMYILFSITYTMNDIAYWGMVPSLSKHEHDRGRLLSVAQICVSIGMGLASIFIPILTVGQYTLGGSAVKGYAIIAVIICILMVVFQLFTLFGVKEKPLEPVKSNSEKLTIKKMFKVIAGNKQLLWIVLIMLLYSIGNGVMGAGLSMSYIYFEFGYNGSLVMLFGVFNAVISVLGTVLYPIIAKKMGRTKVFYVTGILFMTGYILMLIFGLTIPADLLKFTVPIINMEFGIKYFIMMLCYGFVGFASMLYLVLLVSMSNTVEYNEWTTGNREEGLIFSLRPFTAKLGSAITQGLITIIYLTVGVLTVTNQISDLENQASVGEITSAEKLGLIDNILKNVSEPMKTGLLLCMCIIPILFMTVCLIIYKKKFFIDEKYHADLIKKIKLRKEETVCQSEPQA